MARAGQPLGNPGGVVLEEQLLVFLRAGAIGARVAPAVKQVAALAGFAALVLAASAVVVLWSMIQTSLSEGTLIMIWSRSAR